ncbi:carbon-nitrogen hydrolase [Tsukamurella pulmonis]|uniref:Nitrilase n=1 Tax=Tsukamurella pulmonis TaxID=47312 RepID=A0A1H1DHF1_9ACTN|nr:carbon-nitrogen hydrolase family protein [Tsukamurella pulmonis]KXO92332.1 carbon-nitrogen hydrolase [Tsukamurella pulmonis]SDQ75904.1 nitrilase [Tsukamurella pulmonis]SUP22062.1 (R)-stereoselective amidase [Tsukamurella pulmonis]
MTVTVGMYQGPEGLGPEPDVARNLAAIDDAAARAAAGGAQVLVTPELSVTGYDIGAAARELARPRGGEYHEAIAAIARRHEIAIVAGYPERDGEQVFNAVTVLSPDGAELAHYRKTHLFGDLDRAAFAAGDALPAQFDLGGLRCGLLICYDVEFPEAVRAHAEAGTDLLLIPTGLMEPFGRIAEQVVPVRAFESQLYIAYTNHCGRETSLEYCGLSTAASPDGEVVARAGRAEELLTFTADPEALREARIANTYLRDRRTDLY